MADKVIAQFVELKKTGAPLAKLVKASSVFEKGVGERRINKLLKAGFVDDFKKVKLDEGKMRSILGGTVASAAIAKGWPQFVAWLKDAGIQPLFPVKSKKGNSDKLAGKSICWTGYRSEEQEQQVESAGGEVGSFNSKTTVLLYKPGSKESSKLDKAREKGIPVLTWEQFSKKYL